MADRPNICKNDEAVELIIYKLDELRREQEIARRKNAAARILELAKGKTLGGATVRELIAPSAGTGPQGRKLRPNRGA